jgi:polar amino acid transport system permease protein
VWALIFVVLAVLFAAFQFNTAFMLQWLPFILAGVPLTILISILGILLAVPLALLGALGRLSRNPVFNGISGFYVSFIRGTPLIVQIFFIYLGLPQLARVRDAMWSRLPQPSRAQVVLDDVGVGIGEQ